MQSLTTEAFRKLRAKLPKNIQRTATKAYRLWLQKPSHPSLHFKRVHSHEPIWSVRITRGSRALGLLVGDQMIWFWIGSHEDYEQVLKEL